MNRERVQGLKSLSGLAGLVSDWSVLYVSRWYLLRGPNYLWR